MSDPLPTLPTPTAPGAPVVLARNAAWNGASYVVHALLLLVLSPFIVQALGHERFGVWVLVNALTGYLGIADFGIRPAIVHYVARHHALGDAPAVNRYVNSALLTLAAGACLVLLAAGGLAPALPGWFGVPAEGHAEAALALLLSAAGLAVTLVLNAFSAVLIGRQRYDLTCRVDLAVTVARTLGIVGVLLAGGGLLALAAVNVAAGLIEMGWKTGLAFREAPALRVAPRLASRGASGDLLRYGGYNLLVAFALHLVYQTDEVVIARVLDLSDVTFYERAAVLAASVRLLCWAASRVLMPELGARDALGDHGGVARLLQQGGRNSLLLAAPAVAFLAVLGPAFLETWMHGDPLYRERSGPTLLALSLGILAPIASYPLVAAHQGANRMRSLALFSLLEGVVNVVLSVLLAKRLGILGVALGTAVPGLLVHGVVLPAWAARTWGLSLTAYCRSVWSLPLASGGVAALALALLAGPSPSLGWPALIALAALACVVAWAPLLLSRRTAPTPAAPEPSP
jgi:O-antigen/teichoic acid export membrane protein